MEKQLGYKKKTIAIFVKVKNLIQCLQAIIIEHKTICNSIALVIALDLLHNDLKMTTTPFFYLSNKDFEKNTVDCNIY